jgi:hypothetical protein
MSLETFENGSRTVIVKLPESLGTALVASLMAIVVDAE